MANRFIPISLFDPDALGTSRASIYGDTTSALSLEIRGGRSSATSGPGADVDILTLGGQFGFSANPGGDGGAIALTTGNAGGASGSGAGGDGGGITLTTGNGGASGTGTPGIGGALTLVGGTGGAGNATSMDGAVGGLISITGGTAGAANTTGTGGIGGALSLAGGTGGTSPSGADGTGGAATLAGGVGADAGGAGGVATLEGGAGGSAGVGGNTVVRGGSGTTDGDVLLGTTNTNQLQVGPTAADFDIFLNGGLRLFEQGADPGSAANRGNVYVKDDGGDTELFYQDDGGAVVQLTRDGAINAGADYRDNQTVQTTDATVTTIATYNTLANERAINLKAIVWARETATDDSAKYVIETLFNRDGASAVTSKDETFIYTYEDQAAWNVTFNISSQAIQVQVTGEAAKTIEWRCQLEVSEHG